MARIRSIKPEFFRHGGLFDAEQETGLPLRLAFAGLWTACDREGRFQWKARELKLDALPFDDIDFSRVLDALRTRGFIVKYVVDGVTFGFIPSWEKHQVINNREAASVLPEPDESSIESMTSTREARVNDASATPLVQVQGEGKGKEGKGREGSVADESADANTSRALTVIKADKPKAPSSETWDEYASAYVDRYHEPPVRNAKVNGQLAQLVSRLGAVEAPFVARFYVGHNAQFYVRQMHSVDLLLKDAEKLRTEWITGRKMTSTRALQADKTATNGDAFQRLIEKAQQEERNGQH